MVIFMNIRLYNARLLTMENNSISYGCVYVKDNKITYVGTKDIESEDTVWDREIDCNGNLLMPGFNNAHTHSPMSGLRALADDMPLFDWLNNKIFPFENKMTENDMNYFTKLSLLEYLRAGITGIFDMYFCIDAVREACEEYGYPLVMCGAVNNFVQSAAKMEELYQKYNYEDGMVQYRLGFHAVYTTNDKLLREIAELSGHYKAPVYAHLCETKKEVNDCIKQTGMTPIAYLDNMGMFNNGGGGFHCVHLDNTDINILKSKNLSVITCPSSNLKLASGIAPIYRYLEEGINVSIGTDGPSSNNCLNMFKEMFLTATLSKALSYDATVLPAFEVLKMATVNGDKIMNVSKKSVLKEGSYADIVMLDLKKPNMQPENDIISNVVYSAGTDNVIMTMVRGNILYKDGVFFVKDKPEDIYGVCNEITARLKDSV